MSFHYDDRRDPREWPKGFLRGLRWLFSVLALVSVLAIIGWWVSQ